MSDSNLHHRTKCVVYRSKESEYQRTYRRCCCKKKERSSSCFATRRLTPIPFLKTAVTVFTHHPERVCFARWYLNQCPQDALSPSFVLLRLNWWDCRPLSHSLLVARTCRLCLLQKLLPILLDPVPQRVRHHMWLQRQGISPLWQMCACEHLNQVFSSRWIECSGPVPWPPHSPDLRSMDFFTLGCTEKFCVRNTCRFRNRSGARIVCAVVRISGCI
ncbi:hypothetical protein TNCV_4107161 [Trichonephila clavipes]|nr:hypothetical protein TNCV_4107161 [Trichonephila clavipes]